MNCSVATQHHNFHLNGSILHFAFSPDDADATSWWGLSYSVITAPTWCSPCFYVCPIIAEPFLYREGPITCAFDTV